MERDNKFTDGGSCFQVKELEVFSVRSRNLICTLGKVDIK